MSKSKRHAPRNPANLYVYPTANGSAWTRLPICLGLHSPTFRWRTSEQIAADDVAAEVAVLGGLDVVRRVLNLGMFNAQGW